MLHEASSINFPPAIPQQYEVPYLGTLWVLAFARVLEKAAAFPR